MKSFEPGFIERQPISPQFVQTIRLLGEFRGKELLYRQQTPQVLETLRQVAVIQSTESSNRLEGIVAPPERIRRLVLGKTKPKDRSEQEIAGYRHVLGTIHASHASIEFKPGVVLQLHRDLCRYLPQPGGRWKSADNSIEEIGANGVRRIRFTPLAAHLTPGAMDQLHERLDRHWAKGEIEPLLLIAAYVLDFLCIHPFADGNGRMARLLTLLLLYRAGYEVGRYVSLEMIIEGQREGYYESLHRSSQGWHQSEHSLVPWWEYFLGVMLAGAYQELERRTGELTTAHGAKTELVRSTVDSLPRRFRYADVQRACPNVSRPTIQRVLGMLRAEGKIDCVSSGRQALWEKT